MKKSEDAHLTSFLDFSSVFFSTCFFSSYIPVTMLGFMPDGRLKKYLSEHKKTGAGFIGSVAGLLTYHLLPPYLKNSIFLILVGFIISIAASHRAELILGVKDDPRIIIDEWIGMWVAAWGFGSNIHGGLILAFIFFRFFDVYKGPWGRWLQKLSGGWGVVMDDIVAGVIANLCVRFIFFFA